MVAIIISILLALPQEPRVVTEQDRHEVGVILEEAKKIRTENDSLKTNLLVSLKDIATLQTEIIRLNNDRNEQATLKDKALTKADYWQTKHAEAVAKLWWWRLWFWAVMIGATLYAVITIILKAR